MSSLDRMVERVPRPGRRIVFPESTDPRVLAAAGILAERGIVRPVLVGSPADVRAAAAHAAIDLAAVEVEDVGEDRARERYREVLEEASRGRQPAPDSLNRQIADPLYWAAAMVRAGDADGIVAGAAHTTADTLRAYLRVIGRREGVPVVSSFFLMGLRQPTAAGHDVLAFADCGLIPYPSTEELEEIGRRTARSFRRIVGKEPRVAFLSFSTKKSADHESARKMRDAAARLASSSPGFAVDGEVQVDAAIDPEVAAVKAPASPLGGAANVLVFPNLDAGNIAYKLVERLAGARAVGPLLQGLGRAANDLSRGCKVEDIVLAAAVTAMQS